MDKDQAIKAMQEGKKVAHKDFTAEEWMKDLDGAYEFEDGCRCEYREFWVHRDDYGWLEGWKIYGQ